MLAIQANRQTLIFSEALRSSGLRDKRRSRKILELGQTFDLELGRPTCGKARLLPPGTDVGCEGFAHAALVIRLARPGRVSPLPGDTGREADRRFEV